MSTSDRTLTIEDVLEHEFVSFSQTVFGGSLAYSGSGDGWLARKDPLPAYTVTCSDRADEQLTWIASRSGFTLRERAQSILSLGPQPHPYRRIRVEGDGFMLAVQDWRLRFTLLDRNVHITQVGSGYRASQLGPDRSAVTGAPALHREYVTAFATAFPS